MAHYSKSTLLHELMISFCTTQLWEDRKVVDGVRIAMFALFKRAAQKRRYRLAAG